MRPRPTYSASLPTIRFFAFSSQAGRLRGMPRRFAHDEPNCWTSSVVTNRYSSRLNPTRSRTLANGAIGSAQFAAPSRSVSETTTRSAPPGHKAPATARANSRSPSTTERSSDPHGNVTRTSCTRLWSACKTSVASATRKTALPGALRETSRSALPLVSAPITSVSGARRANRTTAPPSPVPRSRTRRA